MIASIYLEGQPHHPLGPPCTELLEPGHEFLFDWPACSARHHAPGRLRARPVGRFALAHLPLTLHLKTLADLSLQRRRLGTRGAAGLGHGYGEPSAHLS